MASFCIAAKAMASAASPAMAPPSGGRALKRVRLGDSSLQVSEACLGTMTFGQQNTEEEAHAQLAYAWERGVNFLDTAEIYPVMPMRETQGRTSEYVGRWLRGMRREDVVVASKVSGRSVGLAWVPANRTVPRGEEENPKLDRNSIRSAVEGELRRLQTDYIDLIQLHWPDRYVPSFGRQQYDPSNEWEAIPFEEQVAAIQELIDEGKIRHWGLSNETTYGVMQHCMAADKLGAQRPVTVQNQYSLVHRLFESELAEACAPSNLNIGLLPWSALAGGALTGKYLNGAMPEGARFSQFEGRYDRFNTPRMENAIKGYLKIAEEAGLTPAQLGYAFCRSRWYIPSTIVGATSVEQLKENLESFVDLDEDILKAIDEVHIQFRNPSLTD